jgi:hypothetical protein
MEFKLADGKEAAGDLLQADGTGTWVHPDAVVRSIGSLAVDTVIVNPVVGFQTLPRLGPRTGSAV